MGWGEITAAALLRMCPRQHAVCLDDAARFSGDKLWVLAKPPPLEASHLEPDADTNRFVMLHPWRRLSFLEACLLVMLRLWRYAHFPCPCRLPLLQPFPASVAVLAYPLCGRDSLRCWGLGAVGCRPALRALQHWSACATIAAPAVNHPIAGATISGQREGSARVGAQGLPEI